MAKPNFSQQTESLGQTPYHSVVINNWSTYATPHTE